MSQGEEKKRLQQARACQALWKKWGPYLSERQWGTVREDYSDDGNAWNYFSHDQARSRAYRWGEDGIAGISDEHQALCFAVALWNGRDPVIKERLFGLTNAEGNHGEDVKEYYYYLDNTPTHSYMKYLYKYPHAAYPYDKIVRNNRHRTAKDPEYELIDTGVFENNRYFDVFVEYAKAAPEDILIRISLCNRGRRAASLHVLPTLWFRNTWAWPGGIAKPVLRAMDSPARSIVYASHRDPESRGSLDDHYLFCDRKIPLLFTENETNTQRLFSKPNPTPFVKDGINNFLVQGQQNAVNPDLSGTKVSPHYHVTIRTGQTEVLRLRLTRSAPAALGDPFSDFDAIFESRRQEADEFYRQITPPSVGADAASVMRQALSGMLWTKQYYSFNADQWLKDHQAHPLYPPSRVYRNRDWFHMANDDIISMPDKWEYPWYAAWDLAFHAIAFSTVDPDFAKQQLKLLLTSSYLHPSGQIPAYEWNFSDVNPPVHAWATLFLYRMEQTMDKQADLDFLKSVFNKLLLNFTWWVNRKDRFGKNVFEGGFLGLDNVGVFDRSAPLPTGGYLEQADGTAWMALFSQNMTELAIELAAQDPVYEDMAEKFVEHFLWIAAAMNCHGQEGMWDDEDGFYYDLLQLPDGSSKRLKVRSIVGLLPLCATTVIEKWQREKVPHATLHVLERFSGMSNLADLIHPIGKDHLGIAERGILALVGPQRLKQILAKMLDENEFLSPYGIRSLSKFHQQHPYRLSAGGQEYSVDYLPGESNSGMFGGNSNWRGPIWMPINALIIRALLQFYLYYGDNFKVECPTGSGKMMNLFDVSKEITDRLTRLFLRDSSGKRPVFGDVDKFQNDPHWRDYPLFYEYFHGDSGAGLGASHQTGWTGIIAKLIEIYGRLDSGQYLAQSKSGHG